MANFLKTGFLLGLGAAVSSKEKVDKYIDELLAKGKVTPTEADELYHSLLKKGEETEEHWNNRTKEKMASVMDELNIVSRDELYELRAHVRSLEERLNRLEETRATDTDEKNH